MIVFVVASASGAASLVFGSRLTRLTQHKMLEARGMKSWKEEEASGSVEVFSCISCTWMPPKWHAPE